MPHDGLGGMGCVEQGAGEVRHGRTDAPAAGTTTFTLPRAALIGLVTGSLDLATALNDGIVACDGDPADLGRLVALLAPVDPNFAIVTP